VLGHGVEEQFLVMPDGHLVGAAGRRDDRNEEAADRDRDDQADRRHGACAQAIP
jgi:hypothetical protein